MRRLKASEQTQQGAGYARPVKQRGSPRLVLFSGPGFSLHARKTGDAENRQEIQAGVNCATLGSPHFFQCTVQLRPPTIISVPCKLRAYRASIATNFFPFFSRKKKKRVYKRTRVSVWMFPLVDYTFLFTKLFVSFNIKKILMEETYASVSRSFTA